MNTNDPLENLPVFIIDDIVRIITDNNRQGKIRKIFLAQKNWKENMYVVETAVYVSTIGESALTLVKRDEIPFISKVFLDSYKTTLPKDSKERKEYPMYEGLLKYFPKALAEVSKVSNVGNNKHNPGQPLHHDRSKSGDHADCIIRHLVDMKEDFGKGVGRDENGVPQVAYIAWRALALAQEWFEENENSPRAPGSI